MVSLFLRGRGGNALLIYPLVDLNDLHQVTVGVDSIKVRCGSIKPLIGHAFLACGQKVSTVGLGDKS